MIVPMKRLTLIAMKRDQDPLMRELQAIAAVQLIEKEDQPPDSDALASADARAARLESALAAIKPYAKKKGMAPLPERSAAELMAGLSESDAVCSDVEELSRSIASVRSDMDKHRALIAQLTPWEALDANIESIRPTKGVRYYTGTMDSALLPELAGVDAAIQPVSEGREAAVLIACRSYDAENVRAALKAVSFNDYTFPDWLSGTPKENTDRLRRELDGLNEKLDALTEQLARKADASDALKGAYDAAVIVRDRESAKTALGATDTTFVLTGWTPAASEEAVRAAVARVTGDCYMDFSDPAEEDEPPTVLSNNQFNSPFESVENMYSAPAQKGIDATAIMTPFYLLFFGMMLSDSGYGLALLVGGILYQLLLKPRAGMKQLARVITMCGASTVICGLFIGTFFGMSWAELFGEGTIFPLLFDPLDNIMTMIVICCGLGIVHMMTGIGIKMYMCFRDGDPAAAIFDNFSWMLLILGLIGLLASGLIGIPVIKTVGLIMAAAGALMILLFAGRSKKNVIARIGGGLGKLYNVTSYLGDTLSYVRILALGLVSGAMGMVFNKIGGMIFNALSGLGIIGAIIGFILAAGVVVAMHAFSLFINTLGTYVHCARLQYVEFFGKFYEANGKVFKPLAYRTKNVVVKND